jgi:fumarylacetoacetase
VGWPEIDKTHDIALRSWIAGAEAHPEFPVQNLPLGIYSSDGETARPGVAIGDHILDLRTVTTLFASHFEAIFAGETLNAFFALPAAERTSFRHRLSELLTDASHRAIVEPALRPAALCQMHMPAQVGDYTDFYVGINHAVNVGRLFRPDNALLPNYKHVPIGYHGRASSLRPSGVPVIRPNGQSMAADADVPQFGPSRRLDYELELGVWIGPGNRLGVPIPISEAAEQVAGLCLLNDWSARDFQAWEYQPLGPFLAKNFQSTISPWVITAEALAPFRIAQPARSDGDPRPLPYLWDDSDQKGGAFSVRLETFLTSARMREAGLPAHRLGCGPASNMYWTVAQIIAHHSSGGCNLNPGDLLGTGTISTPDDSGLGSLLELTRGGAQPITLPTGELRTFLEDGDEVTLAAHAEREGFATIGFGSAQALILPAPSL